MAVVTGQSIVLRGINGLSILLGNGPPSANIGVDGQPGYLDRDSNLLYGPKVAGAWPTVGYQFGGNLLMYAGRPPDSFGAVGNLSLDIAAGFIYGPRTATAWPTQPLLALVGPQGPKGDVGPAAAINNDPTLNSLILSPVPGDTNAVQLAIKNSAGTLLWGVDTNGNQVVSGTLNVTKPATFNDAISAKVATVTGVVNSGNETIAGSLNVTGTSTLGTTKVTAITFPDNTTQTTATVASTGTTNGVFKTIVFMGTYWNTAYSANAIVNLYHATVNTNGNGIGATGAFQKVPFPGSIVGYSFNQAGNPAGSNILYVYKNGSQFFSVNVGNGTGNATFWGTFAKGQYAIAAGDTIIAYCANTSSGNSQVSVYLTLELAA